MLLSRGYGSILLASLLTAAGLSYSQAPTGSERSTTVSSVVAAAQTPVLAPMPAARVTDGNIEFALAEFAHTGDLQPPAADTIWQQVALSDSWRQMSRDNTRLAWYRLHFDVANVPGNPQAIYISRVTNNVAVYINGVMLGVSGNLERKEMSWNLAQLFVIPPQLLKPGKNEILIRLHPDGMGRPGLSRVRVGAESEMRKLYDRRILFQSTAPKFIAVLLGLTAILSLAIWANRRQETVFGYFVLLCMATKARLWHTYTRDIESWGWVVAVPSLAWMMAAQTFFVLRFCGQESRRFERFMAIYTLVSTVLLTVSSSRAFLGTFILVNSGVALVMLVILTRALTKVPNLQNLTLLVAIVGNFLLAMHDLVNYEELLDFDTMYLLPLGGPLLLLAMAVLLIRQFLGVMQQHETLNAELASRVRERELELSHSYEQLRRLDQQRTTSEERQRLMRDMHDGIGSHLMSTLALARVSTLTQRQIEETLLDCIDELKLTIDSLEPVESDLLTVLGNLRYRLEPRLRAAGISLEWAVSDLPPLAYLDPENVRNVLRIVQEAFTNTLKHANAKRITLSTGVDHANARVFVRVTDDGNGIDYNKSPGRGLENMKSRAAKLFGHVEFQTLKGGGTCVNLYLPLAKVV